MHYMVYCSHEHCLNTLFQSIWSQIVHLYGLCSHELLECVFEDHLLENAFGHKLYVVEKNKIQIFTEGRRFWLGPSATEAEAED